MEHPLYYTPGILIYPLIRYNCYLQYIHSYSTSEDESIPYPDAPCMEYLPTHIP